MFWSCDDMIDVIGCHMLSILVGLLIIYSFDGLFGCTNIDVFLLWPPCGFSATLVSSMDY